jgi:replicative DNA helicase
VSYGPIISEEAEKAALGSVVLKPLALTVLQAELAPEDFAIPACREVYEAILALGRRHIPIDHVTIWDELVARGTSSRLEGGMGYIVALANATPSADSVSHYARTVRQKAMLRRLRYVAAEVADQASGDVGDADEWAAAAVARIGTATGGGPEKGETLAQTAASLQQDILRAERGERSERVPTGIAGLDKKLGGGMALEWLVVPAALTSIGKTSWGLQVVGRGAAERSIPGLIFSLEMSRKELLVKLAAVIARVDTSEFVYAGRPIDWPKLDAAIEKVMALESLIRIEEHRSIGHIVMVATAWRATHPGPAVIFVDYLQKVQGYRGRSQSREEEVSSNAMALKNLARDLKCVVIAPAQLDNDAAKENRAPRIGDLRASKAIEHEANVIIGIHRNRLQQNGEAELILLKNRTGAVGKVKTRWNGAFQSFEPWEDEGGNDDGE